VIPHRWKRSLMLSRSTNISTDPAQSLTAGTALSDQACDAERLPIVAVGADCWPGPNGRWFSAWRFVATGC
jgi:hypothetical protein